jgi:hydroxymethylbilane synthase
MSISILPPKNLVIASRESRLAMWQAEHVKSTLQKFYPECEISILGMTTRGDQILDKTLSKIGGKGLFVKELELALENAQAHLAVHSLKDVPMELPQGFALAAIMEREDPLDAFISNDYTSLDQLPKGSVVGTSSLRREAQIRAKYPHLKIQALRGNLDTRLGKLDRGEYAAIILAAAGLKRLGLSERIKSVLSAEMSLPAAGQGALGIEVRSDRQDVIDYLAPLNDPKSALRVIAEREVSRRLGGSCEIPLAAYAQWDEVENDPQLHLRALVASTDGIEIIRAEGRANVQNAQDALTLGGKIADDLLSQGAGKLIPALK